MYSCGCTYSLYWLVVHHKSLFWIWYVPFQLLLGPDRCRCRKRVTVGIYTTIVFAVNFWYGQLSCYILCLSLIVSINDSHWSFVSESFEFICCVPVRYLNQLKHTLHLCLLDYQGNDVVLFWLYIYSNYCN